MPSKWSDDTPFQVEGGDHPLVFAYPAGALDKPTNPNSAGASNTCWGD